MMQLPLMEELVPVREAQKNITRYFEKGITRITKNGRSLGYLVSDKMMDEILEKIAEGNSVFLARIEALKKKTKKLTPLKDVMKEYGL